MNYWGLLVEQCKREKEEKRRQKKVKLKEPAPTIKGCLKYTVYLDGVPIERVEDHNLVVNVGRTRLAELISGKSTAYITQIGFGTGVNNPDLADTALENQLLMAITSSNVEGQSVTFNWYLGEGDANGMDIREFGLFTSDGVMVTHQQRGKVIGKWSDITIEGQYILSF